MGVLDVAGSPLEGVASTHVFRAPPVNGDYPRVIINRADTNTIPHHAGVESRKDGAAHGRHFYTGPEGAETVE